MSAICLPERLKPLLTHIEPLLAQAAQYQLGEAVTVTVQQSDVVDICVDSRSFSLSFAQAVPTDMAQIESHFVVCDHWSESTDVAAIQRLVAANPALIVCGFPVQGGVFDIWHHHGEARAVYCHQAGDTEAVRAMLLAALALDYPVEDAVTLARAYARYVQLHDNKQWPLTREVFPRPMTANHPEIMTLGWQSKEVAVAPFAATDAEHLALYPVVDSAEWVERLLELGVKTTQLRIKDPQDPALEAQIAQIIAAGDAHQAQVFVNDYWQLAIDHQAYGIHLGQEDLETADLTQIQQAGLRLGLSTHGYYEILRAAEFSPSYIALGHIFPTTTKDMPSKPQGLSRLALYQQLIGQDFPTVAIGGIDLSRAGSVWRTGVSSVAVVRAVTQAADTGAAVDAFNQLLVR
ncbi:thiamine-phosphate pyrophosphorylase [Photobacterium swingsii]|uniref:Thiamine-phosphate synthase n=1 Tax=Photobacterium swingsii TaxID=680026 RepID=A0A0J8V9S3_9GAMM|nr:thiamine phosphate synthase [Photobacterium swingsii]KMV29375.1 thiamine-phosphate pyrophosphorylase [Photobacterium swingsii]PSW20369.1 thiamine phosphate synthase [Photobacterium swingsii]